ncbi:sensor histidine kinase [Solibacillus sp. FSL K6-1126]|uniref:sensor histidine kinase n=1 Tax=Solibacillus sp. FSL K6-1126 TaxID=2921463 RepID=UPI0030FB8EFE
MLFEFFGFLFITFFYRYFSIELPFIGFSLFIYTLIAILTVIFYKKYIKFGLLNNKNNLSPIFNIVLLQIIIACLMYFGSSEVTTLPILTIILMVSMLFFIFKVIKKEEKIGMRHTEQVNLTNLERLLHFIRGQRHDHMNHVHVLSHLISTEEYKEASSYLKELSTDIDMSYSLLVLDQPSLIALLQTKSEYARINGVELEIKIKNPLTNVPLKSYELVQVMGNIIDNAFEEEINSKKAEMKVTIIIDSLYNSTIVISVNNINSFIDQSLKKNILSEGYSLKENHQGIGLYTVVNILNKYNGFLEFESDKKSGTTFFLFIPNEIIGD